MDAAFDHAQALYDAAEPPEYPPTDIGPTLDGILGALATTGGLDETGDTHVLSNRQATVGIWIDGREYSLTLNREDGD